MRVGDHFCPGILHAVAAKDGLLVRIRVPGGLMSAAQWRVVTDQAHAYGDGSVEITSRANLQLRGLRSEDVETVAANLAAGGLLPSAGHDRVRNISTSPFAGLERDERLNPLALVRALDRELIADPLYANLHPKFCFGVYGNHRRYSRDAEDVALEAVSSGPAARLTVFIGGEATGYVVTVENAIECLLATARMCLALARETHQPPRGRLLVASGGAMQRTLNALAPWLIASATASAQTTFEEPPWGSLPAVDPDTVCLVPSVRLGRLTAPQLEALLEVAKSAEAEVRLAPWRGVVIGALPKGDLQAAGQRLEAVGLDCSRRDGFRGIAACAGSTGCDASLADVRADADAVAERLHGRALPAGWSVQLSGCEKRCARRNNATVDLIAEPSGYRVLLAGEVAAVACPAADAVDAVAAYHDALLTRSVS